MAREYAKVGTSIWLEPTVRALDTDSSWLYLFLHTQATMNRCGVLPYQPGRWQAFTTDMTRDRIDIALKNLEHRRQVVIDTDTEEVLVRTWVRHDGLLSQPQLVAAMCSDFRALASPHIRDNVLTELRRTWDQPDVDTPIRNGIRLILGVPADRLYGAGKPEVATRITKAIGAGLTREITDAITRNVHPDYPPEAHRPPTTGRPRGKGPAEGQSKGQPDPDREAQAEGHTEGPAEGQPDPPHAGAPGRARSPASTPAPSPTPKASTSPTLRAVDNPQTPSGQPHELDQPITFGVFPGTAQGTQRGPKLEDN